MSEECLLDKNKKTAKLYNETEEISENTNIFVIVLKNIKQSVLDVGQWIWTINWGDMLESELLCRLRNYNKPVIKNVIIILSLIDCLSLHCFKLRAIIIFWVLRCVTSGYMYMEFCAFDSVRLPWEQFKPTGYIPKRSFCLATVYFIFMAK